MIFTFWIHIQLKLIKNPTGNRFCFIIIEKDHWSIPTWIFKIRCSCSNKENFYMTIFDHIRVRCDNTSVLKYTLYTFWRRTECVYVHKVHQINKNELFFLLWYIKKTNTSLKHRSYFILNWHLQVLYNFEKLIKSSIILCKTCEKMRSTHWFI